MENAKKSEENEVAVLMKRAADTPNATDAMHFSQAACNVANAMCALRVALGQT